MQKIAYGKTGMQVTQLGYGSMGLRGPNTWGVRVVGDGDAERMLHAVLDAGINFIDTAPDYGAAEERIGRYLSARRDEFYLATKCGCDYMQHADHIEIRHHFTPEVVRRNLETSLRRLQTDYVDVLQFHGGSADDLLRDGLIELLEAFRQQGRIRHLGVSSSLPQLEGMVALGVFESYQILYSCLEPQHDALLRRVAERGAGVIIRGGIGKGGPEAEIQRETINQVWQRARLDELREPEMSPAELILRFTLSHPACHTTIVGTANPGHLAENIRAAEKGPLPGELVGEINRRVGEVLKLSPPT